MSSIIKGFLLIFIVLFFQAYSVLATPISVELGTGLRWEQDTSGAEVERHGLLGLGVAYSMKKIEMLGEFSRFSNEDTGAALSVTRKHYEFMGWLNYRALQVSSSSLLLGAGVGFFWEQIETEFIGLRNQETGDAELLLGLGGTYRYAFDENWRLALHLRATMNTNNSVAPVADTLIRLNYAF